mmetsp:Transcript_5378/g.9020  ORF Transcript_5378/g.9020 Transcript_5378/m.9020 type:complete len:144 (+) Transcript_5378:135-566(+)
MPAFVSGLRNRQSSTFHNRTCHRSETRSYPSGRARISCRTLQHSNLEGPRSRTGALLVGGHLPYNKALYCTTRNRGRSNLALADNNTTERLVDVSTESRCYLHFRCQTRQQHLRGLDVVLVAKSFPRSPKQAAVEDSHDVRRH